MTMTILDAHQWRKGRLIEHINKVSTHQSPTAWLIAPDSNFERVCIVAHIDTVWDDDTPQLGKKKRHSGPGYWVQGRFHSYKNRGKLPRKHKRVVEYDVRKGVLWSDDGLGADDRAGVWSALKVYREMPVEHRPIVLFCDFEESGGQGARDACEVFKDELKDVLFFVELDRQGVKDSVYYNNECKDFKQFINSYGFKEQWGSFSDISILGRKFLKAGVNLSIGYFNEHTEHEYLVTRFMKDTIRKVKEIIRDGIRLGIQYNLDPQTLYDYGGYGYGGGFGMSYWGWDDDDYSTWSKTDREEYMQWMEDDYLLKYREELTLEQETDNHIAGIEANADATDTVVFDHIVGRIFDLNKKEGEDYYCTVCDIRFAFFTELTECTYGYCPQCGNDETYEIFKYNWKEGDDPYDN